MSKKETIHRMLLRARVRKKSFTLVSNNCWGAHLYQELGVAYETPFVGLFLHPECYLNMLSRFPTVLTNRLNFVELSRHESINEFRREYGRPYPIARLDDDIEIQFLHSQAAEEAAEKWYRRTARMNTDADKIFFKFCDHDGPSQSQLETFDHLPLANKICFVAKRQPKLSHTVYLPGYAESYVPDGGTLQKAARPYFDEADWLNGGSGRPKWYSLTCRL